MFFPLSVYFYFLWFLATKMQVVDHETLVESDTVLFLMIFF